MIMSIFGDIANAVGGAVNSVIDAASDAVSGAADLVGGAINTVADMAKGPLGGLAMQALGAIFPPLAIANSMAGLLGSTIGKSVIDAAQSLTQVGGMPQFIADKVADIVKDVVGGGGSSNPACDHAVEQNFGNAFKDFGE